MVKLTLSFCVQFCEFPTGLDSGNRYNSRDTKQFSYPLTFLRAMILQSQPAPTPISDNHKSLLCGDSVIFLENRILHYVTFWDRLLLLGIYCLWLSSKLLHVLIVPYFVFSCLFNHSLFNHSSIEEHLGSFWFGVNVDTAALNIHVRIFEWT